MQDKKEYIIDKAFEVFMSKGYDSSSMTVLHKELGISRGAMYRYFPSKDDLFISVVDKYIFEVFEKLKSNANTEKLTLIERIDSSYKFLQKLGRFLDRIENMDVKFSNYTALLIQAAKIYPNFIGRIKVYRDSSRKSWKKTLIQAVESGEIRKEANVEILAKFFSKTNNFIEDIDENIHFFVKGVKSGKQIVEYVYSLIKT